MKKFQFYAYGRQDEAQPVYLKSKPDEEPAGESPKAAKRAMEKIQEGGKYLQGGLIYDGGTLVQYLLPAGEHNGLRTRHGGAETKPSSSSEETTTSA